MKEVQMCNCSHPSVEILYDPANERYSIETCINCGESRHVPLGAGLTSGQTDRGTRSMENKTLKNKNDLNMRMS
jgi:hypothetical protein